jgi:pyruvate,water dikinase
MLFPSAAGLLVERGSLLSHSAIVSRELGIPSVVGVAELTTWLRTGDVVELDGRTGTVRLLERGNGDNAEPGDEE